MTSTDISIFNPSFDVLGYVVAVANLNDKHDRSAPSDYHWKILKCRMMIFSHASILACPDEKETKQVHIIFGKKGDDYDKLLTLFMKFSLKQEGGIREVTDMVYSNCFKYTMIAKVAPIWNTLGSNYLINNREFLTANGPQNALQYNICSKNGRIILKLVPIKLTLIKCKDELSCGDLVRVLPSLNKAVVENYSKELPNQAKFKCYKDLKRHWKNIHGYRLPEVEPSYYEIRFWRGDPLSYPQICLTTQMPIVVPVHKLEGETIIARFLKDLCNKMNFFLGKTIQIEIDDTQIISSNIPNPNILYNNTQAVSLCTPTQNTYLRQ